MDEERIDLSPLDPSADRRHWEELVASVTAGAVAARRPSVWRQLHLWARPALATAVALTLLVSGTTWLALSAPATQPQTDDAAMSLLSWAATGEVPSTTEILNTLGRQP